MKRSLLFVSFVFFLISCGSRSENVNYAEVANQLYAEGYFWQTERGNLVDFKFDKSGDVVSYTNGRETSKKTGKWIMDEGKGKLQVSWYGEEQYLVEIRRVSEDFDEIRLSGEIHEYGGTVLRRLRLLDDRF